MKGRSAEAEAVMHRLRGPADAVYDAKELLDAAEDEARKPKRHVWQLLRTPEVQAELTVGMQLLSLQLSMQTMTCTIEAPWQSGLRTNVLYMPMTADMSTYHISTCPQHIM